MCCVAVAPALASTCYGKPANGRLEGGVPLPLRGANYVAYTGPQARIGRNYVHAAVRQAVVEAYAAIAATQPGKRFVYGETGYPAGGPLPPHRTHQSGVSVDFMVPVLDSAGDSVPLPASELDRWGYGHEFDEHGRFGRLNIDFKAAAEHLYQLSLAARRHGIGLREVIFDPVLTKRLLDTARGPYLRREIRFMKRRPWIRHDEHYHVDFSLPCRPLREFGVRRTPQGLVASARARPAR